MIFEMRGRHRNLKAISGLSACGAMPVSLSTSRGHIANEQSRAALRIQQQSAAVVTGKYRSEGDGLDTIDCNRTTSLKIRITNFLATHFFLPPTEKNS
jgi:hypothetical protein